MQEKSSSYKREGLRTVVEIQPLKPRITYSDRIMLMGSCFTEHIGNRLKMLKFSVDLNPFGIVYNPLSIADHLNRLLSHDRFGINDLVYHQDLWHSWSHHSRFSGPDPEVLLASVNEQATVSSEFLEKANLLIITFGTSEAFCLKENSRIVSNCHKLPADRFYSSKPDPWAMAEIWIPLLDSLRTLNPNLRICLTVSPVRYFKDGPVGNQLSKSILFVFLGILMENIPDLFYFPSYEIVMDDLRDYRFYDSDMMHPGPSGVEYVWTRFVGATIDPSVYSLMQQVESVVKDSRHLPGPFLTNAYRSFIARQIEQINALQLKNPFLDFTEELEMLSRVQGSDQS